MKLMDATPSTGCFDGGCAKAELSYGKDPMMRQLAEEIIYERETNDALLSDSRTPDRLCGVRSCPTRRPRLHTRPDLEHGLGPRSCDKQTPQLYSSGR